MEEGDIPADMERYLLCPAKRRHVLGSWIDNLEKQPCVETNDLYRKHNFVLCGFGTLRFSLKRKMTQPSYSSFCGLAEETDLKRRLSSLSFTWVVSRGLSGNA